jgi:hypothetical protein
MDPVLFDHGTRKKKKLLGVTLTPASDRIVGAIGISLDSFFHRLLTTEILIFRIAVTYTLYFQFWAAYVSYP